ncbi:helix-turn-helix domain-containing protein [Nitrosopumilus sp.]|uniref:ArsR family transcriptional regulator n=1 Tax=Nitrosopumilus sp. TaxID=2024843 RepID=UPI00247E3421|nr:helix-turn-helix domain-containing protein [Nitrosopumilus sp.]MCV0410104.1 ArsR family transcriptional regulator [Nitrosopumilus sp.]
MASEINHCGYLGDKYAKLILKVTSAPKSVSEISNETGIPIGTVYRRLEILSNAGFLKVTGYVENGVKWKTYHNRPRRYNVTNPRISFLLDIIKKNPAISYRNIQKISGYPFGTLSNSLSNLEKDSRIIVKRSTRRTHYFPAHISSVEYPVLINLRKETAKKIIKFLAENQKGTYLDFRECTNKAPSTISITLTNLVEEKIIKRISGFKPHFELVDPMFVQNILRKISPSNIDKMKDRFADTFSYF